MIKSLWMGLCLFMWLAQPVTGQTMASGQLFIKGRVVDNNHQGLPGATVLIKGTMFGESTDSEGNFMLQISDSVVKKMPAGPVTITLSSIGFWTRELTVMQNWPVLTQGQNVELETAPQVLRLNLKSLSEVVVTSLGVPALPWPPPQPSAQCPLPTKFLVGAKRLRDVDVRLSTALQRAGYSYRSYYYIPEGFALVTQLEQTDDQAKPMPEPDRWSEKMPHHYIGDWLRNAFIANKGHYRVIIFAVTTLPFAPTEKEILRKEAARWVKKGLNKLPAAIGKRPFGSDCTVTVLVYEFLQLEGNEPAQLVDPSLFSGPTHLAKAGIMP